MEDFTGRVAVVTGGGSGIGRSIALSLAEEGVHVVVSDIEQETADRVAAEARELGVRSLAVRTDVSQFDDVRELADTAYEEFGSVDILANNAGVNLRPQRAAWDMEYRDYLWVMNVNFYGVLHGHMAFGDRMRQTGRDAHIVNTSSMGTFYAVPGVSAYCAAKAAVDAYSMVARKEYELAGIPIGVSLLFPGAVKTRVSTSERLRPESDRADARKVTPWSEHVAGGAGNPGATADAQAVTPLSEVTSFAQAIDPDEVGPLVVDGIRHNYEFISTHPAPADILRDRAERLATSFHGPVS